MLHFDILGNIYGVTWNVLIADTERVI